MESPLLNWRIFLTGCRGLPLSIVVVGGLLSQSEATRENWEVIQGNLSSAVNSDDDGSCLQILCTSYNNLPVRIKPCFLYLGIYDEDEVIPVSMLIQQMVAEGFIKPIDGKSLEEVGEKYLEELIDRNLVLVEECNLYGKLKSLKVHDLLRDLAMREGEKDKFLCALKQLGEISQGIISSQRRIAVLSHRYRRSTTSRTVFLESVEAASSLVRTLIGRFPGEILLLPCFRLLRVCLVDEENVDEYYEKILIRLHNLRFLSFNSQYKLLPTFPWSFSFLWNLQTLILVRVDTDFVLDIWKMPLLRHVISKDHEALCLSDPPLGEEVIVLENLHTLYLVRNLNLSEEVLQRIPYIRILYLYYREERSEEEEEEEEKKKKKGY